MRRTTITAEKRDGAWHVEVQEPGSRYHRYTYSGISSRWAIMAALKDRFGSASESVQLPTNVIVNLTKVISEAEQLRKQANDLLRQADALERQYE